MMFGALRLVGVPEMTMTVEDWSCVRSPARARRRRWKHAQRITYREEPRPEAYRLGDTIFAHPAVIDRIAAQLPPAVSP